MNDPTPIELKNMVRVGTVQSVDKDRMTARVKFGDKGGIVSSPLHILKRPVYVIPAMESKNEGKTAEKELKYDVSNVLKTEKHYHEAYISLWIPNVNDMVLCIMVADGDGDGFIVGEV